MAKRKSGFKLITMVVVAVALFMGLALGEDAVKEYLARRVDKVSITGATTDIGRTIKRYNTTLQAAYAQDKPSLLVDVATEHQITKVRLFITFDQVEKKRKLVATLKSLAIDKVSRAKDKGTARTTETWESKYIDMTSKQELPPTIVSYKVTYTLIKSGNDWLVDSLKAKKTQP